MATPRKRRKASRTTATPKRPAVTTAKATAKPKAGAPKRNQPRASERKPAKARPRAKAPGPRVTTRRRTRPTTEKVSAGGGKKASRARVSKPTKATGARKPARAVVGKPSRAKATQPKRTPRVPAPRKGTPRKGAAGSAKAKDRRRLSRHPEAIRSRKRRGESRGVRDAKAAEAAERARRAAETKRRKRGGSSYIPNERDRAIGWLEMLRNVAAGLYPVSLEITEAESSARTPWLVVGRFDFEQSVSYAELGDVIEAWHEDLILTATIGPERLSQIRIIYNDPRDIRGASDMIVSKSGAYEFILSDLRNELIGFSPDDPDALANRYEDTAVQTMYVYFSTETVSYRDAWRGPTQTIRLR